MENNLSQEENKYMVLNNAESIKHHAEELENAAKKSKHIPAWAVAKIYNASENLSGVTHFIDSSNKMPKEQYERIQEQINEEVKNEYAQGGGIEDYIQLQSNIGLICNKNGVTLKDYHEAKKFYTGGVIDSCETIVNGERQIDADSINKLTECVMNLPQTKSYYLDSKGNYTSSRKQLHKKIINQVKKGVVCIDKGKPIAVLMGGSPASGKTTFLKKYRPYLLSESIFKVDADEIRSMLPEYKGYNASQTHEETSDIVNTLISDKNIGIPCEFDFIYDGTMSSPKKYFKLVELLKNLGYEVFIIFMNGITEKTAKERALQRYKKSGRFVPMSVIEDFFRNGKETLNKLKNLVDGYIVVDGSTPEYNIIEEGGIRLPNERIYEELGNVKLKEGGNTTRKDIIRDTKNKLSKAFTLPIEMSVYVPSTASANEEISEEEFNDRIEEVEVYLSNLFGGFSKVDISGGYNSEEKGLIQESVAKVTAFATKKSFEENKNKLIEKLSYWCKEWGQESMGYEFEGDLYYIDKNFKLENGGGVGKDRYNLSFNYNPSIIKNEYAEGIVSKYTKDWKHDNDWDEVTFYVEGLTKEQSYELKAELKMEDVYNVEIEKSAYKYAKGGGFGDKKFESAIKQQQENINTNSRNKTAIIKVVNDVKKNKHRLSEDKIYAVSKGYIVKSNMSGGVRVYSSNGKYIETEPKNSWSYPNAHTDMHKHIVTIDFKGIVHNIDKMAKGGGVSKNKSKGGIGKSGTQYGYTLKEWEEMARNKGLLVSPKEWWKSQEGKSYTDSFGRKKKIGQHSGDETQSMQQYGYLIANGLDLGSQIVPLSAKKYVEENNYMKYAKGGGVDVKIPLQGTMISKDKKNKIDYKKVGNNYELIVYEGEPNAVENYSRTSFKKKSNGVVTMNHNQFINYIYTEGYVDDKMAEGGNTETSILLSTKSVQELVDKFNNAVFKGVGGIHEGKKYYEVQASKFAADGIKRELPSGYVLKNVGGDLYWIIQPSFVGKKASEIKRMADGGGVESKIRGGIKYVQGQDLEWHDIMSFDIATYGEKEAEKKAYDYIQDSIKYWNGELNEDDFNVKRSRNGKDYKGSWVVMRQFPKFANGGNIESENAEMVKSYNKQIAHHTKEMNEAMNKNGEVPAWVVAKMTRSASDLSDATHFMEGKGESYSKGGGIEDLKIIDKTDEFGEKYDVIVNGINQGNISKSDDGKYFARSNSIHGGKSFPSKFFDTLEKSKKYIYSKTKEVFPLNYKSVMKDMGYAKGGAIGDNVHITDEKSLMNNKSGVIIGDEGTFWLVKTLNGTGLVKKSKVKVIEDFATGGSIGFIPMDLEEDLAITAKWGGTDIKGVIGILNAMIDSGLTDEDLKPKQTKSGSAFEKSIDSKTKEIWKKIEPQYKGDFKGNMYYSTIKRLVERSGTDDNILKRFKPFRKNQNFATGGGVGKKLEVYQQSKWLTKEQWEKWNDYVKTGKIDGKKENNIFTVARFIGVPVAKINAYEIEQRQKKYKYATGGGVGDFKKGDKVTDGKGNVGNIKEIQGNGNLYIQWISYSGEPTTDITADNNPNEFEKLEYAKGGATMAQKRKVGKVMHEFKEGTLHSGKSDKIVKNPKQAIAIALSEAGLSKKEHGGGMGWNARMKNWKKK